MERDDAIRGAASGILAAALFGLSAPLGKILVAHSAPVALTSVLYLSAGVLLAACAPLRRRDAEAPLRRDDLALVAAIAVLGGGVGPVLMLYGLSRVSGVTGALLLNLEAPATMLLAVGVFGEHLGRRATSAAALVVAGAALVSLPASAPGAAATPVGVAAIAGACVAWGLDNNLTQRLSLRDPIALVRIKALAAGAGSLLIALALRQPFPSGLALGGAIVVGALSYGVSILLDAYALRWVGAAREAAYFATAPFFGALLATPLFGEPPSPAQLVAAALMAAGTMLLVRERHSHTHRHEPVTHEHLHVHDEHHQHAHAPGVAATEPHAHVHTHSSMMHAHPHLSDAHHRHRH